MELQPDEEESASELHTATDEGEPEANTGAEAEEADEIERGRSLRRQKLEEADYHVFFALRARRPGVTGETADSR